MQQQTPSNPSKSSYDWLVKILIIGDSGVGKTNMLLRICDDRFNQTHITTLGNSLTNPKNPFAHLRFFLFKTFPLCRC